MAEHKYVGLVVVAASAVAILLFFTGVSVLAGTHKLELKAHFRNAQGLKAGAPVRLAGVDVGTVQGVRVRPELRDQPAEITMLLRTSYKLEIPVGSVARLSTEGVLGGTFVDIAVQSASGPPLKDGGELKAIETETMSGEKLIEKLGDALHKPCEENSKSATKTTNTK